MLSLPTELLVRIFSHFCTHSTSDHGPVPANLSTLSDQPGHHTLASLCLVSRRCRDLAQALLYSEFLPRNGPRRHGDFSDDEVRGWNTQLDSFVRTITKRRDLAALVNRVTFNACFVNASSTAYWTHSFMTIASIAGRLPNLEQYSVDFRGCLSYKSSHQSAISLGQRRIVGGPPPLDGFEYPFGLSDGSSTTESWERGSLHALNLRMPTTCDRHFGYRPSASPRLKVEILRFAQSGISPSELGGILSSCTDLKTVIYEAGKPSKSQLANFNRDNLQIDPLVAGRHLEIHRDTLETLHLDLRYGLCYPRHPDSITGLGSFTVLKTLLVDSTVVCSRQSHPFANPQRLSQMLPPNLVSLQLVGCPGNALPLFAEMFLVLATAIQEGRFLALKRIQCDARSVFTHELNNCFDKLAVAERLAQVGVEFSYHRPPLDARTFDVSNWMWENRLLFVDPDDDRRWTYLWDSRPLPLPGDYNDDLDL